MARREDLSEKIQRMAVKYSLDGFGIIEDFLTDEEVEKLRQEAGRLAHEAPIKDYKKQIFGNPFNARSDYFVSSGDKIRVFFEKNAIDPNTSELLVNKEQSLAKVGHALHALNPVFNSITTSQKVKEVFKAIGFNRPTVVQSMVIYKNPHVGGAYTPHQDASFLCTEPIHLAGIWIALDDATLENGCLQFIPGSQDWPLAHRFVRTGEKEDGGTLLEWTANKPDYDERALPTTLKKHVGFIHFTLMTKTKPPIWRIIGSKNTKIKPLWR